MLKRQSFFGLLMVAFWLCVSQSVLAEVINKSDDGFQIKIVYDLPVDAKVASDSMVVDFAKWWDASHSYAGKAENLSLDLKRFCLFEALPNGGFVRHMEIVYFEPGKALRMTGGLGPLQEMGVSGAMNITFSNTKSGSRLEVSYVVTGASFQKLQNIAKPVDQVLTDQFGRLKSYCENRKPEN